MSHACHTRGIRMPYACHKPSPCVPATRTLLSPTAGRWRVKADPPFATTRPSARRRSAARARADEGFTAAKAAPRGPRPRPPPLRPPGDPCRRRERRGDRQRRLGRATRDALLRSVGGEAERRLHRWRLCGRARRRGWRRGGSVAAGAAVEGGEVDAAEGGNGRSSSDG